MVDILRALCVAILSYSFIFFILLLSQHSFDKQDHTIISQSSSNATSATKSFAGGQRWCDIRTPSTMRPRRRSIRSSAADATNSLGLCPSCGIMYGGTTTSSATLAALPATKSSTRSRTWRCTCGSTPRLSSTLVKIAAKVSRIFPILKGKTAKFVI